jgi:hypothetical protein
MTQSSYLRSRNRGRKAGLNSRELNQTTTRPVSAQQQAANPSDAGDPIPEVDSCGFQLCRQTPNAAG